MLNIHTHVTCHTFPFTAQAVESAERVLGPAHPDTRMYARSCGLCVGALGGRSPRTPGGSAVKTVSLFPHRSLKGEGGGECYG